MVEDKQALQHVLPFLAVTVACGLGVVAYPERYGGRRALLWGGLAVAGWWFAVCVLGWRALFAPAIQFGLVAAAMVADTLWSMIRGKYQ